MTPDNGDYAARIEQLTRRAHASQARSPEASPGAAASTVATSTEETGEAGLRANPAEHGLGPLHPRASRRHAPPEERRLVTVKVKRSRWVRLLVGIGLFLVGNVIAMLYIGVTGATERDTVFNVLFALTWLAPFVAWFALRRRKLGQAEVKGHPLHTLAVMDLGLGKPCVVLRVAEEDMIVVDTVWLPGGKEAEQLEIVANDDLIIQIDGLLVRAHTPALQEDSAPHSKRALLAWQKALAAELGLPDARLPILSPTVSDNFDEGLASSMEYAEIIVKGGLRLDTDTVCDAMASALAAVRQHLTIELDV